MKQQYEEIEQSEDAERILCRLAEFEENFEDMLFGSGSVTEEGAQVEVKLDEVYWSTERMSLPESLEYFSLRSYHYQLHPEMKWAAPVPARCAAAYCFCSRFFCHRREMGLLDASWGFSMTDFRQ